uniref:Uncharacterized protein n=1 Tax=Anguilla anguilla TaxID=7936 RepID=A0A0E9SXT2_ANGAN
MTKIQFSTINIF